MHTILRVVRYGMSSAAMFAADLLMVYVLTEYVHFYYVSSVVIGFSTTAALLFFLNRSLVFRTAVPYSKGLYAALVALTTLVLVTGITFGLVQVFGLYYIVARIAASFFGFAWSYTLDSVFTFDIAPFG